MLWPDTSSTDVSSLVGDLWRLPPYAALQQQQQQQQQLPPLQYLQQLEQKWRLQNQQQQRGLSAFPGSQQQRQQHGPGGGQEQQQQQQQQQRPPQDLQGLQQLHQALASPGSPSTDAAASPQVCTDCASRQQVLSEPSGVR